MIVEFGFGQETYDFEVDQIDFEKAVIDAIAEINNISREAAKIVFEQMYKIPEDIYDTAIEFLKKRFFKEAKESYFEEKDLKSNPYGARGLREKDFH